MQFKRGMMRDRGMPASALVSRRARARDALDETPDTLTTNVPAPAAGTSPTKKEPMSASTTPGRREPAHRDADRHPPADTANPHNQQGSLDGSAPDGADMWSPEWFTDELRARISQGDPELGLFGPRSTSWQVHREYAVMLGGARALLMQAAHPLVIAGARQTGTYERNPWKRLERTLSQTYTVVFGTRAEALAASKRIEDIHGIVRGTDPVTGLEYDARDPDLLLWVHACLVESALLFEGLTVGHLDDAGRQRLHEESMLSSELLRLPRERIPPTVAELHAYVEETAASGALRHTDGSETVANLIRRPPPDVPQRPMWVLIALLAFHTLPEGIKPLYGVKTSALDRALVRALTTAIRKSRPLVPGRLRHILPAQQAAARLRAQQRQGAR